MTASPAAASEIQPFEPALERPVTDLSGVGPKRAKDLARLGVETLGDLLRVVPRGLERFGPRVDLASATEQVGEFVRVSGEVAAVRLARLPRRGVLVRVRIEDSSGSLDVLFFHQPWLAKRLKTGQRLELYGRMVMAREPVLSSPKIATETKPLPEPNSLRAAYSGTEGVTPEYLSGLILRAYDRFGVHLREPIPPEDLERAGLPDLVSAVGELVRPTSSQAFERARRRLALESALELQARILERAAQGKQRSSAAARFAVSDELRQELLDALPFRLTDGQATVFGEIERELAAPTTMRRLLQGDVGSGKTVLGLLACAIAARGGAQAVFMAPTELLAEQHLDASRRFVKALGLRAISLTGGLRAAVRRERMAKVEAGEVDLIFGTHALFSESVRYAELGLAVIDEQHRFGVAQRRALLSKGRDVHVLLMTATPIPRTLALSLYGDFDVSTLRERPPGRRAVRTRRVEPRERSKMLHALHERCARGEGVYWVVPRVESSDEGRGVEELAEWVKASPLGPFGVECVHGRLSATARGRATSRFRSGKSKILCGTTVIEVGVDVPSASAIVIEGAERFGLAQLHQLRGRVGRRADLDAVCYLIGKRSAGARLGLLEGEQDGFVISEHDLRQRGMGDLAGLRQSGANREGWTGETEEDLGALLFAREVLERRAGARQAFAARARRQRAGSSGGGLESAESA